MLGVAGILLPDALTHAGALAVPLWCAQRAYHAGSAETAKRARRYIARPAARWRRRARCGTGAGAAAATPRPAARRAVPARAARSRLPARATPPPDIFTLPL
jgi:hypothetical protein